MLRIAVDAMGGDYAPGAIVTGAVESARHSKGAYEVVLVGDQRVIEKELKHHLLSSHLPISIVHASQQIEMEESPVMAIKKKPDSSISVATRLHKDGKVDAVVSAGNTGAVMASSLFTLNRIEGVSRPAIGTFMPHESGVCFLIDVGSNVDCKPQHLLQFGMMGSILVNHLLSTEKPTVGLLNIGEEDSKGNETAQQAHQLLSKSRLHFIGNVEGRDILRGKADVVVCDGFMGNVILKFGESMGRMISLTLKRKIGGNIFGNVGHMLLRPKFRKLVKLFDYQEYGGAPLLGVKGNCIICHGRSKQKAIKKAIDVAMKLINEKVTEHIEIEMKTMGVAFER
jgi:phosphate acyltransferase